MTGPGFTSNYYEHVRSEIRPLLPTAATRIVDVGCGSGATLAWVGELYPQAKRVGVEVNADLREMILQRADEGIIADLTCGVPDLGGPDLVLLLDVLEHLPDPLSALKAISSQLAPDGTVIVSLPNVAHYSVAWPLFMRGEFMYQDAGILDRTHQRFFVKKSALELMADAGLAVDRGLLAGVSGPRARLIDGLTLGRLRLRLTKQLIMRGTPGPPQATSVEWSRI